MSPEEAIAKLETSLRKQINKQVSLLGYECERIEEEWEGLRLAGGQRADHAAMLLARLRPHLRDLASFLTRCEKQLDGYVADPFQRKEPANVGS